MHLWRRRLILLCLVAGDGLLQGEVEIPASCKRSAPKKYSIELWGKFGLLNNRLRCLSNAVNFGLRNDVEILIRGPWELFVRAVLDVSILESSNVVRIVDKDEDISANMSISCAQFFGCGGPCNLNHVKRAGGQKIKSRTMSLYEEIDEPAACGYAFVLPNQNARFLAQGMLSSMEFPQHFHGYHQRLETQVIHEPVSLMCRQASDRLQHLSPQFYQHICYGTLKPEMLFSLVPSTTHAQLFLASDRFNTTIFHTWKTRPDVFLYQASQDSFEIDQANKWKPPSAMFNSKLGTALYAPRFRGGPQARQQALTTQVLPVLVDMLLLVHATAFFPTPGSTMSQTICFWRFLFPSSEPTSPTETVNKRHLVAPGLLSSCEDLVVVPPPPAPG